MRTTCAKLSHRKEKETLGKWWVKETGKHFDKISFFQLPSKFPIECKACSSWYNSFAPKNCCSWINRPCTCGPFRRETHHFILRKRHVHQRQEELPACLPGLVRQTEVVFVRPVEVKITHWSYLTIDPATSKTSNCFFRLDSQDTVIDLMKKKLLDFWWIKNVENILIELKIFLPNGGEWKMVSFITWDRLRKKSWKTPMMIFVDVGFYPMWWFPNQSGCQLHSPNFSQVKMRSFFEKILLGKMAPLQIGGPFIINPKKTRQKYHRARQFCWNVTFFRDF